MLTALRNIERLNEALTFFGHSCGEAFLQSAVLAAVARDFVDGAVLVLVARVLHVLLHASSEEPLQTHTQTCFKLQINYK
jgi:hypothetical protein